MEKLVVLMMMMNITMEMASMTMFITHPGGSAFKKRSRHHRKMYRLTQHISTAKMMEDSRRCCCSRATSVTSLKMTTMPMGVTPSSPRRKEVVRLNRRSSPSGVR